MPYTQFKQMQNEFSLFSVAKIYQNVESIDTLQRNDTFRMQTIKSANDTLLPIK